MRALVVGYGSIGRRHAGVLGELGCDVAVLSRRTVDHARGFTSLASALTEWQPEYVVVADRTSEHHDTVASFAAAGFRGRVLVEKPLFDRARAIPSHSFSHTGVAYQLRFHPLLNKLRCLVNPSRALTATLYVGSYLPHWRPGTDYRDGYSASSAQGGGALRDLSHELDCALWLLGPWRRLTACGGHVSGLEIDSDDAVVVLMETARCPVVSIQVNYLDRLPRREILVNTDSHTIRVDLINATLQIDDATESAVIERDAAYRAEHQAMLDGNVEALCSFEEAMDTLVTIEAAEQAAASRTWLER